MLSITKKYIVDDSGNPQEMIISYEDFRMIENLLGLDLEEEVTTILKEAAQDRTYKTDSNYVDLDKL